MIENKRITAISFGGYLASEVYDPAFDRFLFSFMGETRIFASHERTEPSVRAWLNQVYQQKGNSNGVSRQTAQANASLSNQSQSGGISGAAGSYTHFPAAFHTSGILPHIRQSAPTLANIQNAYNQAAGQAVDAGSAPEPLKTTDFIVGEIIAWRGWRVRRDGFLQSMSADAVWPPDEPMDGNVKSLKDHCGVYAYKKAKDFLASHSDTLDIYGRVALWGDVIEHELGYRAEYAKVISLDHFLKNPAPHKIAIKDLREKYRCAA